MQPYDPAAFRRFELAGWERKAHSYHDQLRGVTEPFIDALLDAAGVAAGARVLDVATGPGYVAARAQQRGAAVSACDIANSMVVLASSLHSGIEFRQGDAEALPFSDVAFDAVVSNFGLPHFSQPGKVASEFVRVAASGGRIAMSTWGLPDKSRLHGVMLDAVQACDAIPPQDVPPGPPMFMYGDDAEFRRFLELAGMRGVVVRAVTAIYRAPSPDAFWNSLLNGGVRIAALILGQPPDVQRKIRAEYDRLVMPYVIDGRLEIPMVANIGSGRKPLLGLAE
jgi:ubiquinone/menaquinone biosynthesis C-methylase UbiE